MFRKDEVACGSGAVLLFLVFSAIATPNGVLAQLPPPDQGADWRAWADWLLATRSDPGFVDFSDLRALYNREQVMTRLTPATRDFEQEFRTGLERADSDSAFVVYRALLDVVADVDVNTDSTRVHLLSGSEILRELGRSELLALRGAAVSVDSATYVELLNRLVGRLVAGDALWPRIGPAAGNSLGEIGTRKKQIVFNRSLGGYLQGRYVTASFPQALADRWADRIDLRDPSSEPTPRNSYLVSFGPAGLRNGPFVWIRFGFSTSGVDGGTGITLTLLQTANGWVIVDQRVVVVSV